MDPTFYPFLVTLAFFWFLLYWILGGVFFALITILRLGRIRKVRFSCLFTLLAAMCASVVAYLGLNSAHDSVQTCLLEASNKVEIITSVFGCGFAGVLGMFLLGAVVVIIVGFFFMAISKNKSKPWIELDLHSLEEESEVVIRSDQGFFD